MCGAAVLGFTLGLFSSFRSQSTSPMATFETVSDRLAEIAHQCHHRSQAAVVLYRRTLQQTICAE